MSAETELQNLLSHATANASGLAGSANAMVAAAIATLEENSALATPNPAFHPFEAGISLGGGDYPTEPPLGFPSIPVVDLGNPPATQEIDPVNLTIDQEFPSLTLPSFTYPAVSAVARFALTTPEIDATITLPPVPSTEIGFVPQRLDLPTITTPELTLPQPTLEEVTTELSFEFSYAENLAQFKKDIFSGPPGVDPILEEINSWTDQVLTVLYPIFVQEISARMLDKYAPVLKFHAALLERLQNRLNAQALDMQNKALDRSGWGLPKAAQAAINALSQQITASWTAQAGSQFDTQSAELSLAYFEFCLSVFQAFNQGIQLLRGKELEMTLEAHQMSLAYAKKSIAALLAVYETENFTVQEAEIKKAEAKLSVFEAELKLALTAYELAKAKLDVEQAKQQQDANLIQLYQADAEKAQLDVQLYASQVGAAKSELRLVGFPTDLFILKVKAFSAQVEANQATISARVAEIEGDVSRMNGELSKVAAYEAEAKGFMSLIAAKQEVAGAQTDRNEAIISEYAAQVRAVLAPVTQSLLENKYTLTQYNVIADDALADAKFKLTEANSDLEYENKKQAGTTRAYQLALGRNLALLDTELTRLKSIANVNNDGAQILAHMAGGAMSAANGIASAVFGEVA